jgi:putative Holliday junction resolvase
VRAVGLDLGTRRVGVAVSDDAGVLASAHAVLERTGDDDADRAALAAVVAELGAELVVVGLPLSLDGSSGPVARAAREEAAVLAELLGVPVELHDERLTTVIASRRPPGGRGRGRTRGRTPVDGVAAAVILQGWLDVNRRQPT